MNRLCMKILVLAALFSFLSCRSRPVIFVAPDGGGDPGGGEDAAPDVSPDDASSDLPSHDLPGDEAALPDIDARDAAEDAFPDACMDPSESEVLDLVHIRPTRDPMPCGENCRQVSFAESNVWGPYVNVWGDYLVINTGATRDYPNKRIWLIDLDTLDHYIIHEPEYDDPGHPLNGYVDIYESTIAFGSSTHTFDETVISHIDIKIHCISSDRLGTVYHRDYGEGGGPRDLNVFGKYLAWWDGRIITGFGGQAFLYNMETREERLLSPDECCATNPHMYGNYVAWEQGIPGSGKQIWVHDIRENESYPITEGDTDKYSSYVYEDKVLWTGCFVDGCDKYTGKSADIVMKDLATGESVKITDDEHLQGGAMMWDDVAAWSDCRNDPVNSAECLDRAWDVYMKDLSTGEERRLTDLPGSEVTAAMYGNRVYFFKIDLAGIYSVFEITIPP